MVKQIENADLMVNHGWTCMQICGALWLQQSNGAGSLVCCLSENASAELNVGCSCAGDCVILFPSLIGLAALPLTG